MSSLRLISALLMPEERAATASRMAMVRSTAVDGDSMVAGIVRVPPLNFATRIVPQVEPLFNGLNDYLGHAIENLRVHYREFVFSILNS